MFFVLVIVIFLIFPPSSKIYWFKVKDAVKKKQINLVILSSKIKVRILFEGEEEGKLINQWLNLVKIFLLDDIPLPVLRKFCDHKPSVWRTLRIIKKTFESTLTRHTFPTSQSTSTIICYLAAVKQFILLLKPPNSCYIILRRTLLVTASRVNHRHKLERRSDTSKTEEDRLMGQSTQKPERRKHRVSFASCKFSDNFPCFLKLHCFLKPVFK